MSWFGESFSDSLSSLKGQITKITKEVLAEGDAETEGETQSIQYQLKQLEALCQSKDLELNYLREESKKVSLQYQEEIKFLRDENQKLRSALNGNETVTFVEDDRIRQFNDLKNQMNQLKIERDHLEEIQKDHQSNVCMVVQQRDKYKQELEKMKNEFMLLEHKYNELYNSDDNKKVISNNFTEVSLDDVHSNNDEVVNLRNIVEKLQIQIESYHNEKEDTSRVIERHMLNCENLKEKIDKLLEEIKILNSEKENSEIENGKLQELVASLKSELSNKVSDIELERKAKCDLDNNVKKLKEEIEKCRMEHSDLKNNFEDHFKKLFSIFDIDHDGMTFDKGQILKSVNDIETMWKNSIKERENKEKTLKKNINVLQGEVVRLKNETRELKDEMKVLNDKKSEMEASHWDEMKSKQDFEGKAKEKDSDIQLKKDQVKSLKEEVSHLTDVVNQKNVELSAMHNQLDGALQELKDAKNVSEDLKNQLLSINQEKERLEKEILLERNKLESKENQFVDNVENIKKMEEECELLQKEKFEIHQENCVLKQKLDENSKVWTELENAVESARRANERLSALENELQNVIQAKSTLETTCSGMQQEKSALENQTQNLKAMLIVKESKLGEMEKLNQALDEEVKKSREETAKLSSVQEEFNRWKESMIELEIQRQDLTEQNEALGKERDSLRSELDHLMKKCQALENSKAAEVKEHPESSQNFTTANTSASDQEFINNQMTALAAENNELKAIQQQQAFMIENLALENNHMKQQCQLTMERLTFLNAGNERLKPNKTEPTNEPCNFLEKTSNVQQHRRSKSAANFDASVSEVKENKELLMELENLRAELRQQRNEHKVLQEQHSKIAEKEARARKELERLRLHLIEIENDYTETIDEYKTKLNVTEEQLKSSSTFYTSNKVRDNQHLESLQSQIRLMAAQRDDLQVKLSSAEDEVQKHKAALTSFHVVLEQFQQDKERELESITSKYKNQLFFSEKRFAELQAEASSLNGQLADAKNGLKAASRLGEQLERKNQQVADLEKQLSDANVELRNLEQKASEANQSNHGKIDKFLVKNLLVGYISSQQADRKSQVLRILASVLEFDEDDKTKVGVDGTQTGWLSNLLHPKADGAQTSQSLSEAFIRFLENESRPQPQLKLLPERPLQTNKSRSSSSTPKSSLLLQELVLPTFNSLQTQESTILKDVLKES